LALGLSGKFWPIWIGHPDTQLLHATVQLLLPITLKLGQSIVGSLWPWHARLHKVAHYLIAIVVRDQAVSTYRPDTGGSVNAKRLVITGRVNGVGDRAWMVHKATELGLSGWVRNRPDGAVEALIVGDIASVEELSRLCRRGPRMAEVVSTPCG
jgi:acylphosphatase